MQPGESYERVPDRRANQIQHVEEDIGELKRSIYEVAETEEDLAKEDEKGNFVDENVIIQTKQI